MKYITTKRIEGFLILGLGTSIFLSKPSIYIFTSLIIILAILRAITDLNYRTILLNNKIFITAGALYTFGILSTAIGSLNISDTAWIARKSLYLLLIGPLIIAYAQKSNQAAGFIGIILGFWISFMLTANKHDWQWNGQRLDGATWLIDNWAVLCALLTAFLLPIAFQNKKLSKKTKVTIYLTLVGALLALLTTGARGPWIGVVFGCAIFLAIYNLKNLLGIILIIGVLIIPAKEIWPTTFHNIQNRVSTIVDLKYDESNQTRIAIWITTYVFLENLWRNGDKQFWLGSGQTGFEKRITNFNMHKTQGSNTIKTEIIENRSINDAHNMYLDSVGKNGIIWTIGSILLLIYIGTARKYNGRENIIKKESIISINLCIPLLVTFLIIGIFYSVIPHFATYFFIFFITLSKSFESN